MWWATHLCCEKCNEFVRGASYCTVTSNFRKARLIIIIIMPNPICEKCKQSEQHQDVVSTQLKSCDEFYAILDKCMKLNDGNISSCRLEWSDFRVCFHSKK